MSERSWRVVREQVYQRANACCEYCQTCEDNTGQALHIEHIDPSGGDALENLCLACANCNLSKAATTSVLDPTTGEETALFNPRQHPWTEHFAWIDDGLRVLGLTAIGRVIVVRLKMNRDRVVRARQRWIEAGFHPPR